MKKINFTIIIISLFLISCNNEDIVNQVESLKYESYNGNKYLKFKDVKEYRELFDKISIYDKKQLDQWSNANSLKTLNDYYEKNNIPEFVLKDFVTDEFNYVRNQQRVNMTLSTLYNIDGIMQIGDTIYKIKNDYLYKLPKEDIEVLKNIERDSLYDCENVIKEKHTIILQPREDVRSSNIQKSIEQRSAMFYTSSTDREYINIEAYVSGGYIRFEMRGRKQEKVLVWLFPSESNLVYGSINGSGTYGDNSFKSDNPTLYNVPNVFMQLAIGSPATVPFNLDVTYKYKKTNKVAYTGGWKEDLDTTERSYTRNYYWQQF